MNAVLYMAATGCQWRMLPKDLPPHSTVQRYFYDWRDSGLWRTISKTHLAIALGRERSGRTTRCSSSPRPPSWRRSAPAHADGRLEEKLVFFAKPKLLIVDELGYLPFDPNAEHLFFQPVSRRYERGSMLITSNRSVGEGGTVFGDPVVATAILDRLLHHSTIITIRGDSYRLREKP